MQLQLFPWDEIAEAEKRRILAEIRNSKFEMRIGLFGRLDPAVKFDACGTIVLCLNIKNACSWQASIRGKYWSF